MREERGREIFHLRVHSPDGYNCQVYAKPKPKSSICVSHVGGRSLPFFQEAGLEMDQVRCKVIAMGDAHAAGGSFAFFATMLSSLLLFKDVFVDLKGTVIERVRDKRYFSSIGSLSKHSSVWDCARSKPGSPSRSPIWMAGAQILGPPLLLSQVC